MDEGFTAVATVSIDAPAAQVWRVLTSAEAVPHFMFGARVVSDWQQGSTVTYSGVWNNKAYTDTGTILSIKPFELLQMDYHYQTLGPIDDRAGHRLVTYELQEEGAGTYTFITITQQQCRTQQEANKSSMYWEQVLEGMKQFIEASSS